ncbi:GSCFA domain-containing protein [Noviherbaspirillum denitrificans]|uniref:GSCFA domain-containing protein n=1 Tax=Noviherbaspirillum denitrificans TaxID=1968433 RepID=UPI000B52F536|nr:GSCFA domain-containing protein [Noviherbaspirillum denitrificans]
MNSAPDTAQVDSLMSMISSGKWTDAESMAAAMTVRFPDWVLGWKVLGVALVQLGRPHDALNAMQRTVELQPHDVEAHSNLAVVLQSLQRLEEAKTSLEHALEIAPNEAVLHFNLGSVLKDLSRLEHADSHLQRALELKHDYARARLCLDEVRQLKLQQQADNPSSGTAERNESAEEALKNNEARHSRHHPYTSLPSKSFWKAAIAERDALDIADLWNPKFSLAKSDRVITTGSCFAQHISRALKSNGFNWFNAEPAPAHLDEDARANAGYDVFSFRLGNVYTARQLRQWTAWALGLEEQSREIIRGNGRYFDPFRPTIPQDGFASEEELWAARDVTLQCIRTAVRSADVFVFTLGLTEAWMNKQGFIYPLCPGTIRGTFSKEEHFFHNFTFEEIYADLDYTFSELRRLNPDLRFLLTVSPVPLTATATQNHVLVATTYSKSVLRAVAGTLTDRYADVDYFPSYEIITAPPFEGRFFDQNRRTVTSEGVAFVMRQFLSALEDASTKSTHRDEVDIAGVDRIPAAQSTSEEDVVCEEIILDTWSRHNTGGSAASSRIMLIGDSQMGMLADALTELNIPFSGGGVMWASQWHKQQFTLSANSFFEPLEEKSRMRWKQLCANSFIAKSTRAEPGQVIITNVGMQTTQFLKDFFDIRLNQVYGNNWPSTVPVPLIQEYLQTCRSVQWLLVKEFVNSGARVICVSDPAVQPVHASLYEYIDSALLRKFNDIGCETFNAREWLHSTGRTGEQVRGADGMHGMPSYYKELAEELLSHFKLHND